MAKTMAKTPTDCEMLLSAPPTAVATDIMAAITARMDVQTSPRNRESQLGTEFSFRQTCGCGCDP